MPWKAPNWRASLLGFCSDQLMNLAPSHPVAMALLIAAAFLIAPAFASWSTTSFPAPNDASRNMTLGINLQCRSQSWLYASSFDASLSSIVFWLDRMGKHDRLFSISPNRSRDLTLKRRKTLFINPCCHFPYEMGGIRPCIKNNKM